MAFDLNLAQLRASLSSVRDQPRPPPQWTTKPEIAMYLVADTPINLPVDKLGADKCRLNVSQVAINSNIQGSPH